MAWVLCFEWYNVSFFLLSEESPTTTIFEFEEEEEKEKKKVNGFIYWAYSLCQAQL